MGYSKVTYWHIVIKVWCKGFFFIWGGRGAGAEEQMRQSSKADLTVSLATRQPYIPKLSKGAFENFSENVVELCCYVEELKTKTQVTFVTIYHFGAKGLLARLNWTSGGVPRAHGARSGCIQRFRKHYVGPGLVTSRF